VVEGKLAVTLTGGIRHDDLERLETAIRGAGLEAAAKEAVAEELEAARERQDDLKADRLSPQSARRLASLRRPRRRRVPRRACPAPWS
jgi:hypothetical protein